ncbi:rhodanese-like domain-containing protein [Melghirimyces algeriensis]|nr:rhodanese-like domain-containing protein [Melghirimyces algeriensis]
MTEKDSKHRIGAHSFAKKYRDKMLNHALLLDVREPKEWEIYHLEDALLIPLQTLPEQLDRLDPKRKIYVYCAHGVRSVYAVNFLYTCGYHQVVNVDGGLAEVSLYLDSSD